ncbi:MAG: hypothetical protein FWE95_04870 [Planctomycetaceae bacterium]|nr:hypothetical protein [Planctomycetaceae bacterium]
MSTPLPRGIEILLKKASVDAEFRELLLADSNQAAMSIELELAPVEQAMLQTLPKEQLATVIDRTEVPLAHRRAFLGTAAATMLALLTGSQDVCAQGVYGGMGGFTGTSPDVPKAPMGFVPNGGGWGPAPAGIQPDVPPPPQPVVRDIPQEVRQLVAEAMGIVVTRVTPLTRIILNEQAVIKLRREIYRRFDVRLPLRTLKTLATVALLSAYIVESLDGYDGTVPGPVGFQPERFRQQPEPRPEPPVFSFGMDMLR